MPSLPIYPIPANNYSWSITNSDNTVLQQAKFQEVHTVLCILFTALKGTGERAGPPQCSVVKYLSCSNWLKFEDNMYCLF